MIKIIIELECNEKSFSVNAGRIDKYATDETEKRIGKKYFNKLEEILRNLDTDSLIKECVKDSKKECKNTFDELIDLMFGKNILTKKKLNEKQIDLLVDEILNSNEELKNCDKESIKKILDEIMEED